LQTRHWGHHEGSEEFSDLSNESLAFSDKHPGSLPRHSCDECRHRAARNQTLRKNAEFIYKTGDHKSPPFASDFQGVSYDVFGRLVNEAKPSMAVSRFPLRPSARIRPGQSVTTLTLLDRSSSCSPNEKLV